MDAKRLNCIYEQLKTRQFELGALYGWRYRSVLLKYGADQLYDRYDEARVCSNTKARKEFDGDRVHIDGAGELTVEELQDERDIQLLSVYYLLIGFAIENLLKGIIITRYPERFDPESKKIPFRNHGLVRLCKKDAGIVLNPGQEELLGMLETQIIWKGRYPVPREEAKMDTGKPSNGAVQAVVKQVEGRKSQEEVDALYLKLYDEFKAAKLNKG